MLFKEPAIEHEALDILILTLILDGLFFWLFLRESEPFLVFSCKLFDVAADRLICLSEKLECSSVLRVD